MPLTDAQLREYAGHMAGMRVGGHWPLFQSFASRDLPRREEWQHEYDRVMTLYRSNEGIQRCIRSGVHQHYMSCAQEARCFTERRL